MLLKVEGPDIYILPLTGKPEQQQFTMRSGVLTSISSRKRSAISQLPEWTFHPQSAARQTHLCPNQLHSGLHLAMFSGSDSLVLVVSVTRYYLLLIYLSRGMEG